MNCLLIDDDIPTLEVMRDIMNWEYLGVEGVFTAHNISDAKEVMKQHKIELIVCDIEMPRGSGLDMIKWVRDNEYESSFIFFTCHENFDFAKTAIAYDAEAYLIKPFDKNKMEAAIAKAVNSLIQKDKLQVYKQFGETWLKNKSLVEQSFWRDVIFERISPRHDLISREIQRRDLSLQADGSFYQVLVSILQSDLGEGWNLNLFQYAFSNLTTEFMTGEMEVSRVVNFDYKDHYYNAVIIAEQEMQPKIIYEHCQALIVYLQQYFRCKATCYISPLITVEQLAHTREELEELDRNNLIFRGKVHWQNNNLCNATGEGYNIKVDMLEQWFLEGEKLQIVNKLKQELEHLVAGNTLNATIMHAIHQDFMQVVYSVLYKNKIQAHKLFADSVSQSLLHKSESSVLDMMKWASYVTNKTIDYLKEMRESVGVVDKVKTFIHTNYSENINREAVASNVYLTPDYLSKLFKKKTGLSINDYLNEYRIQMAKQLLIQSKESVSSIALQIGFENLSYFSTVFKKITGETPLSFRSKHNS